MFLMQKGQIGRKFSGGAGLLSSSTEGGELVALVEVPKHDFLSVNCWPGWMLALQGISYVGEAAKNPSLK